ncbi:hypothetical protein [Amycolatopsis pigmentata]|uniref:Uncharacterized protein n=1 Tax=Amycolatopsis pigmentata TaxID=450801 RepID=A0ABW5G0Z3_9PSEU
MERSWGVGGEVVPRKACQLTLDPCSSACYAGLHWRA